MTDLPDPSVREPEGAYFTTYGELAPGQPFRWRSDTRWWIRSDKPADMVDASFVQALPLPPVMVTIEADLLEMLVECAAAPNVQLGAGHLDEVENAIAAAREAAGRA